ncbi:MAG: AarF/ABC1/UbiB kinase family protein, partial [Nodosilinea sp.]
LALSLNPDFKIVNVAYPYVARRLLLGETPALRQRLLEVLFQDGQLQWDRLENMLAIARGDTGFDLLPTAGLGIRYLMSEEGISLRQMIVLALTEDDRLHTQEVQRLWALVKDEITFDRVIEVAWGALTNYSLERAEQLVPAVGDLRQALQT